MGHIRAADDELREPRRMQSFDRVEEECLDTTDRGARHHLQNTQSGRLNSGSRILCLRAGLAKSATAARVLLHAICTPKNHRISLAHGAIEH